MFTLKQKATKFRNAIYRAKKHGDLDWHSTFSKFPDDCCDMTCDLLGQYLLESGIETYQINGVNKYDSSWHHVWLITTEGVIVDITGDQFVGKILNEDDVDPVHVGREGIVHKIFYAFFVEKGTSITEAQTEDGDIPVVAGGKDMAYFHNASNRPKGCITISASGANSGYVNYWDVPIWASDCITLRSKNEMEYSTKFLYHILRIIQDDIYLLQKGSDQPHVYGSDVKYIKIPPISIELQTSILSDIQILEQKILTLQAEIKSEASIIDSVFSREFGWQYDRFSAQRNEKNYWVSPSNFSNNIDLRFSAKFHRSSGAYVMDELKRTTSKKIKHFLSEPIVLGASVSPNDYDDGGNYRYISMATIKNWKYDFDSANIVSDAYSEAKSAKTVKKNDIILARSGEGTIGKVALIQEENPKGIFADFTMRIRLKDYNPEFAYYYFRTTYFQYLIEVYKKGLGNNTNIFPIVVREFPLIDIPISEQDRIVAEIHTEISNQEKLNADISKLQKRIDQMVEDSIS